MTVTVNGDPNFPRYPLRSDLLDVDPFFPTRIVILLVWAFVVAGPLLVLALLVGRLIPVRGKE